MTGACLELKARRHNRRQPPRHGLHELKVAVWRHKRNGAVGFKFTQLHAAVERAVVNFHAAFFGVGAGAAVHEDFVVQAKLCDDG